MQKMRLDVLVIQLCENDVLDQSKPTEQGLFEGTLVRRRPRDQWERCKAVIISHSEVVARVRLFTEQIAIMRGDIQPYMLSTFDQLRAPEIQSTRELLHKWIAEATALNQRVFIVYTPIHMQVEPSFQSYLDRFRKQGKPVDVDAAHHWLLEFVKDEPDVTYVDVVTPMREKAKSGELLFLTGDTHNNPQGNKIIAQEILKALGPLL
jgi:lysophospholipase L1-like esterase